MERRHRRRIARSFAIATKEVTVGQFQLFRPKHEYNKGYSPSADHPVNMVKWFDAAAYCNWLSAREGIPEDQWCYETDRKGQVTRSRANYLRLAGYRLPTEAEWEYACRSGAASSRYYGDAEELLEKYACYGKNSGQRSMFIVGRLKPNDLGLFDMLGNAGEWCQGRAAPYVPRAEGPTEDGEDEGDVPGAAPRVLRGGNLMFQAVLLRSAHRFAFPPGNNGNITGFRVARTINSAP
jgi:formylglycine-generating enzyme required for sulfatase activity